MMRRWQDLNFWAQIATILALPVAILGIVVSVILARQDSSTAPLPVPTSSEEPAVEVLGPVSGQSVERETNVYGTARGILPGRQIWLVVQEIKSGAQYYPHEQPCPIDQNSGDWSCTLRIGPEQGSSEFVISVLLADEDTQRSFREYFKNNRGSYPGLSTLPASAGDDVQCQVPVKRLSRGNNSANSLRLARGACEDGA